MVKYLPTTQESQVQSLGREDSLEKEVATHSSTLAWKIPWTEEPGKLYSPLGRKELDTTERLHFTSLFRNALFNVHIFENFKRYLSIFIFQFHFLVIREYSPYAFDLYTWDLFYSL